MNTKLLTTLLITAVLSLNLFAKELKDPELIFAKKCVMCHNLTKPEDYSLQKRMAAPPIGTVMKNLMIGIGAIEEPANKKELDTMTIEFIKDYLFFPTREKSYCEDISFQKFGMMPSMSGFLTKNEAAIIAPWVVKKFAPQKGKDGKYITK